MPYLANGQRELFLMSPPGPSWKLRGRANFRSDAADGVDAELAFQEWLSLARAIEAAGGRVFALPSSEGLTGMPYCAEAGQPVIESGEPVFLMPRMWAPHRQEEHEHWRPAVTDMGFRAVDPQAGLWEGQGDVATFQGTTLLFFGGRSDREGLDAVRAYFPDDSLILETQQPAFHGNVAVLPIDAIGKIVVCPELLVGSGYDALRERFGDGALLPISLEEARNYCTNALPIGNTLIAPTVASQRVLDALSEAGMSIVGLDMRELCEKAGGASRCLVCRVPPAIAAMLPNVMTTDLDVLAEVRNEGRA